MEDSLQVKLVQLQAELDSLHKAITVLNQLAAELDIHTAMQNVRQVALELLDCERVTLFLIFERRRELRAMIDQNQILRIKFGEGIAGLVAQAGGSMNLPDVYAHPMFNKEVDRITGFRTRSMLCMAVSDMTGKNVAVLQALNKKSGQPFTPADERNLKLFGTHLGNTLVKAKLHETAKREKERLQAIYNCFKTLSAAEEMGQMVICATAALERHIIHAERVLFFLVDKPRGELWLHTHQAEPVRLRIGQQGGVVGLCAETKKPQSWAEFVDPSSDPALGRLPPQLAPGRIKSVLVQPIHGTNNDRVLAVVLALNKREAEGTSDIFFEPFFTDADCDAMALFAYEVGDLLSERTLELSLLSALSVVGHDGAHPSAAEQQAIGGSGADGGDGSSTPGGPPSGFSLSGDEDFIRSRLIQMYLPEYKMEVPGSHGPMFNRNSFSAATATANQMRASIDRKRAAGLSLSLFGDGGPLGAKRGSSGTGPTRRSDLAVSNSRMSLAVRAAATRSFGCAGGTLQSTSFRSLRGMVEGDSGGAASPGGWPDLAATGSGAGNIPPVPSGGTGGSPRDAPGSPLGGFSDASGDLPLLPCDFSRSRSSTQAEHPTIALRYGCASNGAQRGNGMSSRSGGSISGPTSGGARDGISPPPTFAPTHTHLNHLLSPPQWNGWSAGGGSDAGLRRMSAHERLMAPWRRSMLVQSAAGSLGPGDGDDDDDISDADVNDTCVGGDRRLADTNLDEGARGGGAEAGGGGSGVGMGRPARGASGRRAAQLPEPFVEFAGVYEELRAAAEDSLKVNVGDPQALRTHLSCTNLTQASSPRSPCFYPAEQLNSWSWDFTEFTVEELIKLAYDIFIVSGAMEDFQLQPKILRNFLTAAASHYQAIPYHNFNHVCHVLQATYLVSSHTAAVNVLTSLERLALLIAALCHDLDHDGHSNSFHVNSGSELARIYNDQSVMENHHCAMTFAILSRTDCNVLAVLSPEEQRTIRKVIISAILCTDMANHFALTQEFQKHGVVYEPDIEPDRLLLTKVILHAADIGNAVRPFYVNHAMSRRVHREFEAQAHEELALGLPVTFSVDTSDHVMCARVELNFLDYVVSTLWERLVDVLPELAPQMAQLRINRTRYRRIADTGRTADQVLAEEEEEQRQRQLMEEKPVSACAALEGRASTAPAGPSETQLGSIANGETCAVGADNEVSGFGSLTPLEAQISGAAAQEPRGMLVRPGCVPQGPHANSTMLQREADPDQLAQDSQM
ncbi:hypothetical protein Vafri_3502 [Volvox africanus]|uniref:Phosphodiesterase n=2 Tax=Volvox africanus TaxID=51714 RepID=A0A8J4EWD9_9CHLO|nr:hypothetical protein Vafri_3502 [Volvox africanus]